MVQTGAKTQLGGLNAGFARASYHAPGAVAVPISTPPPTTRTRNRTSVTIRDISGAPNVSSLDKRPHQLHVPRVPLRQGSVATLRRRNRRFPLWPGLER